MSTPVPEYLLFADVHIKSNAMCAHRRQKGRQNTPAQILNIYDGKTIFAKQQQRL